MFSVSGKLTRFLKLNSFFLDSLKLIMFFFLNVSELFLKHNMYTHDEAMLKFGLQYSYSVHIPSISCCAAFVVDLSYTHGTKTWHQRV